MTMIEAYIRGDSRGQWFIIGDGTLDDMNTSGEWLKTLDPVEVLA